MNYNDNDKNNALFGFALYVYIKKIPALFGESHYDSMVRPERFIAILWTLDTTEILRCDMLVGRLSTYEIPPVEIAQNRVKI